MIAYSVVMNAQSERLWRRSY